MTTADFYLNDVWNKTLSNVSASNQIDESALPYFNSKLISLDDNKKEAVVMVPDFINYSIMSPNLELLSSCLEEVINKKLSVRLLWEEDTVSLSKNSFKNDFLTQTIDPNQTFTNFVVGRSNVQAHLAAMTCASNPSIVYNPLFIYGESGLGKTHLLNAIGNQASSLFPDKQITYISIEKFVSGIEKASNENRFEEFKKTFNDLDILLIDDIQFIGGKTKTQEIFFTIFNELVNNKKQICIASDRTPNDIKCLENRIISRFNQGLKVNIEAPEYETSINILKMKISNNATGIQASIDDDVLSYLATNFSQDVRSLEGAVNRLLFYSICFPDKNEKDHISLNLAIEAFKEEIKDPSNELSISTVRKAVCDYYNLTKQQIISANRTKNISTARQIAMYLSRKLVDATFDDIGREFGGRDHSTVMSACTTVENKIKSDPLYLKAINDIEAQIR